jgi:GNAT superfamily N-acetyltransferase
MTDSPDLVTLRPAIAADRQFLLGVYAGTRLEELAALPWDEGQKEAFVQMQFDAQNQHYRIAYPQADNQIILVNSEPVGRMIVDRAATSLTLVDISLLPSYRQRGIGTRVLLDLLQEALDNAKPVHLHVRQTNPAKRLYERLGFFAERGDEVYCQMKWMPKLEPMREGN